MMVRFALAPLLILLALASACSPTEPPLDGLEVSTHKSEYRVNEGFNLRVLNRSGADLWLETSCGGRMRYDIEERVGWHWELWFQVNSCPAFGVAQPRALFPAREMWESGFWTIPPGRYRVKIQIGLSSRSIGALEIYSNEFTVR